MLFALAATIFIGFIAIAIEGFAEAHAGVNRISNMINNSFDAAANQAAPDLPQYDEASELRFSQSLLALNKVHSQLSCNSPEPELAESSSLVSVRPAQSKSRAQES